MSETPQPPGRVVITHKAIATLASQAALHSYGVVGMASRNLVDGIVYLLVPQPAHRPGVVQERLEGQGEEEAVEQREVEPVRVAQLVDRVGAEEVEEVLELALQLQQRPLALAGQHLGLAWLLPSPVGNDLIHGGLCNGRDFLHPLRFLRRALDRLAVGEAEDDRQDARDSQRLLTAIYLTCILCFFQMR